MWWIHVTRWSLAVPACGAPTHSSRVSNGCAGWAKHFLLQEASESPKPRGEATESNNICSNIFWSLRRNGSRCHRHIKLHGVIWVSGISDGPFFSSLSTALSRFKADNVLVLRNSKVFSLFHVCALSWWQIAPCQESVSSLLLPLFGANKKVILVWIPRCCAFAHLPREVIHHLQSARQLQHLLWESLNNFTHSS